MNRYRSDGHKSTLQIDNRPRLLCDIVNDWNHTLVTTQTLCWSPLSYDSMPCRACMHTRLSNARGFRLPVADSRLFIGIRTRTKFWCCRRRNTRTCCRLSLRGCLHTTAWFRSTITSRDISWIQSHRRCFILFFAPAHWIKKCTQESETNRHTDL